jgi:hypothetical protein
MPVRVGNWRLPTRAKFKYPMTKTPEKNVAALPEEIWEEIAFFTCADGGKTASALLRVSRAVAHGAELHVYTFVSLTGPHSIESFTNNIAQHPDRCTRVRALFIAERDDGGRQAAAVLRERRDIADKLPQLLSLVSPYLYSLALIRDNHFGVSADFFTNIFLSVPLPALRFLILRTPGYREIEDIRALHGLTHLYISVPNRHDYNRTNPLDIVAIAATRLPSIERITLSVVKSISITVPNRIREALSEALTREGAQSLVDMTGTARSNRPVGFTIYLQEAHKVIPKDVDFGELEQDAHSNVQLEGLGGEEWDLKVHELPECLIEDTSRG